MVYTITEVHMPQTTKIEPKCCLWKEILLAILFNIPYLTHGMETNNLTSSAHTGHFVTTDYVQWTTTAMVVAAGVAAPIFCYVIDRFGRKMGIFGITLVQAITLIPHFLLNKNNVYNIQIILHVLAGISSAGLFTILPIYLREITVHRGFCICLMVVMTTVGYVSKLVLDKEVRLYAMVALVGIQCLGMVFMVESPGFLVMKNDYQTAKRSLSKLKSLPEHDLSITQEISNLKGESDRAKANGALTVRTIYRTKIWLDGIKVGFMLYTVNVLCGSILFLDQHKTLVQLGVTDDPQSVLVLGSLLAGSVCCFVCITFLDRKYLLTAGYTIITLSTGVLAVYTQENLPVTSYRIVPIVSLGILVFGYGIVWGLPTLLVVEMYNIEIRATFISIIFTYSQILKLLHVHTFKYLENYVGVYTMFYIFASINLYGVVYTLFAVPNTKRRTVRQIERQLKRPALPA